MIYAFESAVRYSEADADGRLSVGGLVDYFQDTSVQQSDQLLKQGLLPPSARGFWVLAYWHIRWKRRPVIGERIEAGTFASEFTGAFGRRNFYLNDESGEAAIADSLWAYVDNSSGRPVRPDSSVIEPYGRRDPIPMPDYGRKIRCSDLVTEQMKSYPSIPVRRFDLDTNHHMNNAVYIKLAWETALLHEEAGAVPVCMGKINCIRVEYRKAAEYGDVIHPYVYSDRERIVVALCDRAKRAYALVELRGDDEIDDGERGGGTGSDGTVGDRQCTRCVERK